VVESVLLGFGQNKRIEDMPYVSVIIPNYNLKEYLPEAVGSVLSQTFTDWECIIIDDASTDDSASLIEEFSHKDARFRPVLLNKNVGVSEVRNIGLAAAKGEYILFLDADDLITPGYLEAAVSAFAADSSLSVVYGKAERFDGQTSWDLPAFSMETMLARNCLYISCFFRREQAVPFDSSFKVGFEDWDFWLSLLEGVENPKVLQLQSLCFRYRARRHSRNTGVTDEVLEDIRRRLWEKHKGLYSKYFCNPLETIEFKRMERSFRKASRWSLVWKLRLLYRRLSR